MYKTSVNYDFFLIINSIILEEFYVAIKLIEMHASLFEISKVFRVFRNFARRVARPLICQRFVVFS